MYKLSETERIALVAENTDNLVVITNAEKKIVWVNKAYTQLTGYTLNEVVGKTPGFLQCELTNKEDVEEINRKLDLKETVVKDLLNRNKEGREYWIRLTIAPAYVQERFVGYISIEREISEERELMERLADSELRYKAIFNSSQDRHVFVDSNYVLRAFNTAAAESFRKNYAIDIVEGEDFRKYVTTPGLYKLFINALEPALKGKAFEFEAPITLPNGAKPWFKFKCVPVAGANKDIIGVSFNWAEITKEKELLRELEEGTLKYRAILDSTEDRHILLSNDDILLAFNKSAAVNLKKSVGLDLEEGLNFVEYFRGHEQYFLLQLGLENARKGKSSVFESPVKLDSGEVSWLRLSYYPVEQDGAIVGVTLNWTDITQQKLAEEKVLSQLKQLEQFSHITSHKLRQPLANIIGLTNLIENTTTSDEERPLLVAQLKSVADGLDCVIKEMTDAVAALTFSSSHHINNEKPIARGNHVFIIDDDPVNNLIAKKLLERTVKNIEIKEFINPQKALEQLANGVVPDLILLDINMEPMDGWGFLTEFEKLNLSVQVVMCSSSIDPADLSRAKQHNLVTDFLSKPLTTAHIKQLLAV
jgi:PAS domain S-box-containing protein